MTRAMVGLQGPHLSDAFICSNMSSSVGLKSFCPWCFKLGSNTEMIATHLREVHYRFAIMCDLCKLFGSISAQNILDHLSGCKAKCTKNPQNKKDTRRWKSHIRKSLRCENRKKHPKARSGNTEESCRVKRCPTPSVQFCWWMWVDSLLRSCWVILTLYSGWVFAQPPKLSCFYTCS